MKNYKLAIWALIIVLLFLLTSSCAHNAGNNCETINELYGFWGGLWHGIVIPFTWIGSLFSENIAIYAINNNGGWYDFGFVLGVGGIGKLFTIKINV